MTPERERLGPFEVLEELGRGSQAVVYRVRDIRLDRELALKVFARSEDPCAQRRFEREAGVAARLHHPGICPVHEAGVVEGRPYIAMRYVRGRSLAARIEDARAERERGRTDAALRLPLSAWDAEASSSGAGVHDPVVRLVERAARAVHAAHERGVVHRDLKPANLIVTPEGDPVIVDFGLARDVASEESTIAPASESGGTPAYMAPEQLDPSFGRPDRRTDVHALGAVLFECLTLRKPFVGTTRESLYHAILNQEPARIRRFDPRIPRDLETIVATALAREPDRRYQTARALAGDLRRLRERTPLLVRPRGPLARFRSWARRRPQLAAGLTALAVSLVLGSALSGRFFATAHASLRAARLLGDLRALPHLVEREATEHWPARPEALPTIDAWLDEAQALLDRRPVHAQELARLRATARPDGAGGFRFADPELRHDHDEMAAHIERMDSFATLVADVRDHRDAAASIHERSVLTHLVRWRETTRAIAEDPRYGGLDLPPQIGLVPVDRDPDSGLFEFAHLSTGAVPARDPETGRLVVTEETGVVLVLLPGGTFAMGSRPPDALHPLGSPNVDPHRPFVDDEQPVHEITLAPFFLSKYELTRAQWRRATREADTGSSFGHPEDPSPLEPLEAQWQRLEGPLLRLGLVLPTEAQWELGARGGTTTIWWTGDDAEGVRSAERLAELQETGHWWPVRPREVGRGSPNPFGLYDVLGNLAELVRDRRGSYELPVREGDGERLVEGGRHVTRGGSSKRTPVDARCARRLTDWASGVRPARAVDLP